MSRHTHTRSTKTWDILISKYIKVHHIDSKYITKEQAHNDLLELYNEYKQTYSSDAIILAIIHKLIHKYHNEVRNNIYRQEANALLSLSFATGM